MIYSEDIANYIVMAVDRIHFIGGSSDMVIKRSETGTASKSL